MLKRLHFVFVSYMWTWYPQKDNEVRQILPTSGTFETLLKESLVIIKLGQSRLMAGVRHALEIMVRKQYCWSSS